MQAQKQKYFILTKPSASQVQISNTQACLTLVNIIKSCLGPKSFQKLILTKINSLETTNDCNSILRELDVSHPVLKILCDLARTQEKVGDGTTSVVILCAELLAKTSVLLTISHPIFIIRHLREALEMMLKNMEDISYDVEDILFYIKNSVNTKLCTMLKVPIPEVALETCKTIMKNNKIDLKDVRIEKIVGEPDFYTIKGVMINKNIIHPQMRRKIENGRIYIIDSLEFRKGESQISYEISNNEEFTKALRLEEEYIVKKVDEIVNLGVDLLIVEKGVSDLAYSLLQRNNITALRRFKMTEIKRIKKACDCINNIGTFKKFEQIRINNEYFCKIENDNVVTVVMSNYSRDIINDLERNFDDAVKVARNLLECKKVVPGGGSFELFMSKLLVSSGVGLKDKVFNAVSDALKIIPTLLCVNSGVDCLKMLSEIEEEQKTNKYAGFDGNNNCVADMRNVCMEPVIVKTQMIKSAIDTVCLLLKVDGIIETK